MSNNATYSVSRLELAGTPAEIGRKLGRFCASAVHGYLVRSSPWETVQQWKGSAVVTHMAELTRQRVPDVWAELEGLAQGLELPVEDVFLWNARGDLWAMAPDGCTSILI